MLKVSFNHAKSIFNHAKSIFNHAICIIMGTTTFVWQGLQRA